MSIEINIEKKLKDYTLDVEFKIKNERLALLGNSGSGKSMTLKSIAGIIKPDSGNISLNGKEIFNSKENLNVPSHLRRVGLLFQDYALFPNMTVLQNLTICTNSVDKFKIAERLLKYFKVSKLKDRYPYELSGGQQQRVAMARMIITNPQIILLDEPFSALDTNLRWEIENDFLNFLKSYESSAILVTHNRDEAYRICDKVAILSEGKIVDFGDKDTVFKNPSTVASAKIVGYKNIITVNRSEDNFYLRELNLNLTNIDTSKNTAFAAIKSEDIYLKRVENCEEVSLKLQSYVEDTKNIVAVFNISEYKILTVEIPKVFTEEDKKVLSYLKDSVDKVISIYLKRDKIVFLEV